MGLLTALLGLKIAKMLINGIFKLSFFVFMVAFATFYISNYKEQRTQTEIVEFDLERFLEEKTKKDQFCNYKYRISNQTKVCSLKPLSKYKLEVINYRTIKTLNIYPKFAKKKVKYKLPLSIYVIDIDSLNNSSLFKSRPNKRIVVRYLKGKGKVFVSPEMFLKIGETDLQHELAHYINDNIGYSNEELDENLAYAFEKYYKLK